MQAHPHRSRGRDILDGRSGLCAVHISVGDAEESDAAERAGLDCEQPRREIWEGERFGKERDLGRREIRDEGVLGEWRLYLGWVGRHE